MDSSNSMMSFAFDLIDKGAIPDWILRPVIRYLCKVRLNSLPLADRNYDAHAIYKSDFVSSIKQLPSITAPGSTSKANSQHYEVSTAFVLSCLGPRAKYSACVWETEDANGKKKRLKTLAEAEDATLDSYCKRASLKDGMGILDLGCGMSREFSGQIMRI